ncbi:hypothetical protein P43SY_010419 [Pythium insidiosum]|uniref:Uncharacterized protein n=1 Tax=Pythium insidiosum TaxID=114742 RepID=A0AAD5Q6Y3_PYTIN|nr:hypothetical protein P43SY_010419 [Pythium insidiosum]
MRFFLGCAAMLLAVGASHAADATAKKCQRLTDPTAGIYQALKIADVGPEDMKHLPLHKLMEPVDKEMPWLSSCLASTDIMSIGLGLLSDPVKSKCIKEITSMTTGNSSAFGLSDEYFSSTICPAFKTSVLPCVDSLLVDTYNKIISTGGECCSDMAAKMKENVGQDMDKFLQAIAVRIGDVICSTKTYKNIKDGAQKTETCGFVLIDLIASGHGMLDITKMLQVPSSQSCAAMKGEKFTTTIDEPFQFFVGQNPWDSCFAPINNLLTDIGSMPGIASSNQSALFAKDKCLKGQSILSDFKSESGLIMEFASALEGVVSDMKLVSKGEMTKVMQDGFEDMEKDFGPLCFHVPNAVSDCVYNYPVQYAFSKDAPPRSDAKGKDASGPGKSSSASPVAVASAALMAPIVAIAALWL